MAKREKIIVLLMALAVLYGGYEFFLASKSKSGIGSPEHKEEVLDKFVTDAAVKLKKKDISEVDKYIIARAKDEWPRDPFVRIELPSESELKQELVEASALNTTLTYSGYMEMGGQKLAVINGMEYMVGDELEPGSYIVKSISATQVVIGIKGTKQTIILEVEEMK
ncbi:hypothetical protein ACFLYZ_00490 [Thermodesulfobacteriota bacterium]